MAATALIVGTTRIANTAGGSISGKVTFTGAVPAAKKLPVTRDHQVCGSEKTFEEVAVGVDKGLKDAVVMLVGVKSTPRRAPVPLDQKGCEFTPRVVVVPAGGTLDILNNDGILHNVHTRSTANPSFNKGQPGFLKKMTEKFGSPEAFKVGCDVHKWMSAWVVVSDSAFAAVTDAGGHFKIDNVPPGRYKLELWHETLGKQSKDVVVRDGAATQVDFEATAVVDVIELDDR